MQSRFSFAERLTNIHVLLWCLEAGKIVGLQQLCYSIIKICFLWPWMKTVPENPGNINLNLCI